MGWGIVTIAGGRASMATLPGPRKTTPASARRSENLHNRHNQVRLGRHSTRCPAPDLELALPRELAVGDSGSTRRKSGRPPPVQSY